MIDIYPPVRGGVLLYGIKSFVISFYLCSFIFLIAFYFLFFWEVLISFYLYTVFPYLWLFGQILFPIIQDIN